MAARSPSTTHAPRREPVFHRALAPTKRGEPEVILDEPGGKIVVERHIDVGDVIFDLMTFERLSPLKVFGTPERHLVTLALSPLTQNVKVQALPGGRRKDVGTLNFYPAGTEFRSFFPSGRHRWLCMRIKPDYFRKVTGAPARLVLPVSPDIRGTAIDAALYRVAREMSCPDMGSETVIRTLSECALVDFARYFFARKKEKPVASEGLTPRQLTRVVERVENADGHVPTISEIAAMLGLSRRHLTRLFKMSVGLTVHAYVGQASVRKAMDLLTTTDKPVKEIAHKLGFSSPSGFSTAFRAATGQSPGQFRKGHRAG